MERFRQRVPQRSGQLDTRAEIVRARLARLVGGAASHDEPPAGATERRGSVYVRDLIDRDLPLCLPPTTAPRGELVVGGR